jgi:hypothetical protein
MVRGVSPDAPDGGADQLLPGLVQIARLGHHLVTAPDELLEVLGELLQRDLGFLHEAIVELGMVVPQRGRAGEVVEVKLALSQEGSQAKTHLPEPRLELFTNLELERRLRLGVPDVGEASEREENQRNHHECQLRGDAKSHITARPRQRDQASRFRA